LKESEGGTLEMCELVEEYAEKKAKRREMQVKLKNAKNFIDTTNLPLEDIARCVELPLAVVEGLANHRTA
jgi:hypothetical protein